MIQEFTVDDLRAGRFLVTIPEMTRFFESIDKNDGCWEWQGFTDPNGYGRITIRNRHILCHVLSYVLHKGPILNNLHVLHSCDNPKCVNPSHLWIGTHQDNMDDMAKKGRSGKSGRCGENINFAILKEPQVIEIRKCVAAGAAQKDMADRFNVHKSTIHSLINRRTWKQI